MKENIILSTANKRFLVFFFFINLIILWATFSQKTHFIGNVITPSIEKTVRTTQFFDSMHVRMTKYPFSGIKSYDATYYFEPQLPNGNMLINDEETLNTLYFKHFRLDERCSLMFKHPSKMTLEYLSMACRY